MKLDLSKAYDRVEWRFLEEVMRQLGFGDTWIHWIMCCIRTVSYQFVINGELSSSLIPERGLRQGDSISPYLFLLCTEVLSRVIARTECEGELHGIAICKNAPSVSHLFFADDSFIFFKSEFEECLVLKDILASYAQMSGQSINFDKSCISFSRNVPRLRQDYIAELLGVVRVEKA